ncbi:glutathione S-transferase family protein [Pseudomonas sp. 5P_3.1_Bac2]|uniref:glutathione S-transferase family protein n=1 Tax=Pseudomonas sp. 5P_3.1_Bac2 TaxID=2971617 RepID=UPI0021C7B306|nr:glutathione S-transferase family protein [Pseudomonas sp. 5P_3.1_Bac2]MCU1716150.1 glutathione S-transferase family protein [Pseudomonas sp. 5P_3.1_Bac2]
MSLIVYGAPLSPFVRKVRLFLAELDLEYQLEIIRPFDQPEWYYELNPLGRIPALKDGDLRLADSSVICQYLSDKHPERPNLLGDAPAQRAQVRWLEKYADYELAPQCTFAIFRNRTLKPLMGQTCDEQAVQSALQEKLPKHFDYLENILGEQRYFVGERLSLADLAIGCQLINMEHGGEVLDAQRWPQLSAHFARFKQLASVQAALAGEQRMLAKMTGKV